MMLPCTPMQFLLFHEAAGRPADAGWLRAAQELLLVMTSANPGGEPLVIANGEALARLDGIADALLMHDRDIVARCDDRVLRLGAAGAPPFIRRARGYTPRPMRLPRSGPSVLACGAWLKNTVCVTRGDEAFLSPHVGDLDNAATCRALDETVDHLCACSTSSRRPWPTTSTPTSSARALRSRFAADGAARARRAASPRAHRGRRRRASMSTARCRASRSTASGLGSDGGPGAASCCASTARPARASATCATRDARRRPAAREPWRMAAAALHRVGRASQIEARFASHPGAGTVARMLARDLRCPRTSSMGRWFDAAAALLRVRETSAYEGQAPTLLEALAAAAAARARRSSISATWFASVPMARSTRRR